MKLERSTFYGLRAHRRLAIAFWATTAAGLILLTGLAAAYFHLIGANNRSAPASQIVLPKALAEPNSYKPLTVEQALKANDALPFAQRVDGPARRFILQTNSDNRARAIECLAQAVYYEAGSESADGQRAVSQVILNRLHHPGYPASVCGVVYQGSERVMGCQFTFTCDGSLLHPPNASAFAAAQRVAIEALAGRVFAPVGHATNYHADYVFPYWADDLDKEVQIGRHIFYRLKGSLGLSSAFGQRYAGLEPTIVPQRTIILTGNAIESSKEALEIGISGADVDHPPPNPIIVADSVTRGPLVADERASGLIIDQAAPSPSKRKPSEKTDACAADASLRVLAVAPNDLRSNSKTAC